MEISQEAEWFFPKFWSQGFTATRPEKKSSCICEKGKSWGKKCWLLFISLCGGNNLWFCSVTFPWTSFEIIIHLIATATSAFYLRPLRRGETSNFSSLLVYREASIFLGTVGAPHPTVLSSWSTWWKGWEKTSGVQSPCKLSHLPRAPPLRGAPGNYWQKSVQMVLGSVNMQSTVLLSALENRVCRLKKHIIITGVFFINYCLFWSGQGTASAHCSGRDRRKHFPSDSGNFPLLLSKIVVINWKVEGGGFSPHAKAPHALASWKWQEFTSSEDADWAWLISGPERIPWHREWKGPFEWLLWVSCHASPSGHKIQMGMSVPFPSDIRKPKEDYVHQNFALQVRVSWLITQMSYTCDLVQTHTLCSQIALKCFRLLISNSSKKMLSILVAFSCHSDASCSVWISGRTRYSGHLSFPEKGVGTSW